MKVKNRLTEKVYQVEKTESVVTLLDVEKGSKCIAMTPARFFEVLGSGDYVHVAG